MSIVGIVVMVFALIALGLQETGNAPAFLIDLNLSPLVWFGIAAAGAAFFYFTRRPGN